VTLLVRALRIARSHRHRRPAHAREFIGESTRGAESECQAVGRSRKRGATVVHRCIIPSSSRPCGRRLDECAATSLAPSPTSQVSTSGRRGTIVRGQSAKLRSGPSGCNSPIHLSIISLAIIGNIWDDKAQKKHISSAN
jgi:hypothetical protein